MTYYTLTNKTLTRAKSYLRVDGKIKTLPTAEDYAKIEAYPRDDTSFTPPKCDEGYHAVADGYEVVDGKWVKKWRIEALTYTYDDYNRALEDYLYSVRAERGYTDREPTEYIDSKVPRWDSDGRDYRSFRDDVMLYALPILNKYKNNEEVPTFEEFKAGFPVIEWTFKEEEE